MHPLFMLPYSEALDKGYVAFYLGTAICLAFAIMHFLAATSFMELWGGAAEKYIGGGIMFLVAAILFTMFGVYTLFAGCAGIVVAAIWAIYKCIRFMMNPTAARQRAYVAERTRTACR